MKKNDKLDIIYEDKYLIAVLKKSGLLTISTDKEQYNTLYRKVSNYVKKQHKSNKIFIIHRLDKDTSGIVIFAKTEKIKHIMQDNWDKTKRVYIALVEGKINSSGVLKDYLLETNTLKTYVSKNNKGKLAITEYKPIAIGKNNTLLEINILTGRKNQIRCQLSNIGHPIVGDKKYNAKTNPFRRICLHATKIYFIHPITKKEIILNSEYPLIFNNIVKNM